MHPFKFLDKPVIGFGDPHPGFMASSGGEPVWEGELFWETSHGAASVLWVAGRIAGVYGAKTPDGGRAKDLKPGLPESDVWRREAQDGRLVHGRIELSPEDVTFVDSRRQPAPARWGHGSLPSHLLSSDKALAAVSDTGFAVDLYGSLCSSVWALRATGRQFHGDWARSADIVAQMRGRGEISVDFYLNGNEGYVTDGVTDLLDDLGWGLAGRLETPEQEMDRAAKLVEVCEARPIDEMPSWYVHWINGLREGDELDARLHRAAFAGRVAYKEWVKFWELFDFAEQ